MTEEVSTEENLKYNADLSKNSHARKSFMDRAAGVSEAMELIRLEVDKI